MTKIKLNYIDPDSGIKCTLIQLQSGVDSKNSINERMVDTENIVIKRKNIDSHGDAYSRSTEEDITLCQKDAKKPSWIKIRVTTEKKKRANSKKTTINSSLQQIDLYGKEFDLEVQKRKEKFGNNVW